jgi:hypothetical protein
MAKKIQFCKTSPQNRPLCSNLANTYYSTPYNRGLKSNVLSNTSRQSKKSIYSIAYEKYHLPEPFVLDCQPLIIQEQLGTYQRQQESVPLILS